MAMAHGNLDIGFGILPQIGDLPGIQDHLDQARPFSENFHQYIIRSLRGTRDPRLYTYTNDMFRLPFSLECFASAPFPHILGQHSAEPNPRLNTTD